jgi:hypothetical protein
MDFLTLCRYRNVIPKIRQVIQQQARRVFAWPRKAGHRAGADRVGHVHEDNWDRPSLRLQRPDDRRSARRPRQTREGCRSSALHAVLACTHKIMIGDAT